MKKYWDIVFFTVLGLFIIIIINFHGHIKI